MEQEIISRISKGSKMDQIYIPKNRIGLTSGSLVVIKPLIQEEHAKLQLRGKHFLYGVNKIESIKIEIINRVFSIIEKNTKEVKNIIIFGSFLEEGFYFNDLDILIISEKEISDRLLKAEISAEIGVKTHILQMTSEELIEGLKYDPLYLNMISRCVAKNRIVFNIKRKINAQLLDLNLLKSKTLIDNFDALSGREMYYLTKNMIAILLFIRRKNISSDSIDKEIKKIFKIDSGDIKEKILNKNKFLIKYKEVYEKIFKLIIGTKNKNGSK